MHCQSSFSFCQVTQMSKLKRPEHNGTENAENWEPSFAMCARPLDRATAMIV